MMKAFLIKNKKVMFPVALVAVLFGMVLTWFGLRQTVTVVVEGEARTVQTSAVRVSGALRAAGVPVGAADRVQPERGQFFWKPGTITVEKARAVTLRTPENEVTFISAERLPANLLRQAEILLYPQDQIWVNGARVDPNAPLAMQGAFLLQFGPAFPVTLALEDEERTFYTSQLTLGAALEVAGIAFSPQDWLSVPLETAITGPLTVTVRPARTVTVTLADRTVIGLSAALTVGAALQDLGIPLQNLDSSIPPEDADLPADGQIRVVRGSEELVIITEEVPYTTEYQEDPGTPLDQTSVIQPGQPGIYATRERALYQDGAEVSRISEGTWKASDPQAAIVGTGTQIVEYTEEINGETISYYRKLTVYAHSYKPCITGTDICYYGTASGLPVDKGIVAVSQAWYSVLAGQRVYIPSYGYAVIADTCGACAGQLLVDLGYSEEGYPDPPPPNRWITMYLLTPVPDYVPVPFP